MQIKWMSNKRARALNQDCPNGNQYNRSIYLRDYGFIAHSTFFRRLSHKTQVYSMSKSDHTRTRLTHSIEVSQIGAQLAGYFTKKLSDQKLFSNQLLTQFADDFKFLTMTACLSHDIGHPPFGHKGKKLLEECANEIQSEFDDNKQAAHILVSPILYEDLDISSTLVASTFKKTDISEICYSEDCAFIANIIDELELKNLRHPASVLMEAADDIAYISADLEDYLRYFSKDSPKDLLKKIVIKNLNAVNESYEIVGTLEDVLLDDLKSQGDERYQKAVGQVVRSLIFHTCKQIDGFFERIKISDVNLVPALFTEYLNKFSYKGEQSPLYLDHPDGPDRGTVIKKLKSDLYGQVLNQYQIGRQDILAGKVIRDLWPILKPLCGPNFEKTDIFKILPDTQKGLFRAARSKEQGYTPERALLDYLSGMTDRYAISLWEKLSDPNSLAA